MRWADQSGARDGSAVGPQASARRCLSFFGRSRRAWVQLRFLRAAGRDAGAGRLAAPGARRARHPGLGIAVRFPADWQTRNTPRAVLAHPRDKEAAALLTAAGKGDDPARVARDAERAAGVSLLARATMLEVNGLRGVRSVVAAEGERPSTTLGFTWIAHEGRSPDSSASARRHATALTGPSSSRSCQVSGR